MSVAGALLVRDERDIIEYTIRHLATQVDEIIVSDNLSSDGTRDILNGLRDEGLIAAIYDDTEIAYMQSAKMTRLADRARRMGHDWIVPVDADEYWVAEDGGAICDYLSGLLPHVHACKATVFDYLPTAEDGDDPDPFRRIGWRRPQPGGVKVAARLKDGLVIEEGNHSVSFDGRRPMIGTGGLRVNHYSWRSAEQYTRKVRNGARAYLARPDIADLPDAMGPHWRMFGDPDAPDFDERTAAWFHRSFWSPDPRRAQGLDDPDGLVYDPA